MRRHKEVITPRTRKKVTSGAAAVAAVALALAACSNAGADDTDGASGETAEEFFEGETIRWVIPFAAGGGTDVSARQLAPLLSRHIPGEPTIQIENVEGAGSVLGTNQFATGEADGLTMLMTSSSTSTPFLFGDPAVRFDFADFTPIAGIPAGAVQYVHKRTGVEQPLDIYEPDEPLIYGGITPGGGEIPRLLGFNILDLDVDEVFGYDSRATIQIAFSQGETNFDGQTTQTYLENIQPLVEAGEAVPVYTSGIVENGELIRDPRFPDLPTIGELYEERNGELPSGEAWEAYKFLVTVTNNLQKPVWMHGDAPEVAVDAIRTAFEDLQNDPEYQGETAEAIGYDFVMGETLEQSVQALSEPPQDILDWLRDFAADEYDADLSQG